MSQFIDKNFVSNITNIDLVSYLNTLGISVKQTGANHSALCPLHNEKSPSFTIYERRRYVCFGCGAKGDIIDLTQAKFGLDFVEAVEKIANEMGLSVPKKINDSSATDKNIVFLKKFSYWFKNNLLNNNLALQYLSSRDFNKSIIERYGIGYAPENYSVSTKDRDLAIKNSMLTQNKHNPNSFYPFFRNRIIFTIYDEFNQVIGFGGRVLNNEQKPKYLNSKKSDCFDKSNVLYGLSYAKKIKNTELFNTCVVCEGYFDVIRLLENNIAAVASLGTSFTEQHLKILLVKFQSVVFAFDSDKAGIQAAIKAMHMYLSHATPKNSVKFLFLPNSEDPDSFIVKKSANEFIKMIKKSYNYSDFFLKCMQQEHIGDDFDLKVRAIEKYIGLANEIKHELIKKSLLAKIAHTYQIPVWHLIKGTYKTNKQKNNIKNQSPIAGFLPNIPLKIATMLAFKPELVNIIDDDIELKKSDAAILQQVLEKLKKDLSDSSCRNIPVIKDIIDNKDSWLYLIPSYNFKTEFCQTLEKYLFKHKFH